MTFSLEHIEFSAAYRDENGKLVNYTRSKDFGDNWKYRCLRAEISILEFLGRCLMLCIIPFRKIYHLAWKMTPTERRQFIERHFA